VIVSTLDSSGGINCSAKGIAGIEKNGRVFIIDLFRAKTFRNLKKDPAISITAVDEHQFAGYTHKGSARIVEMDDTHAHIVSGWQKKMAQRIARRMIRNIRDDKKSERHPESHLPRPQYLIEMHVEKVVDLAPAHSRGKPF
jgi:hypothetical protein